jgi:hypothetical protein
LQHAIGKSLPKRSLCRFYGLPGCLGRMPRGLGHELILMEMAARVRIGKKCLGDAHDRLAQSQVS